MATPGTALAADTPDTPDTPDTRQGLTPEQRAIVRRCLTALGVLGIGSMIGVASSLYLANRYPLVLIALSPIGRHLILVAPTVDPLAFIAVAVTRRLAFYTACFFIGRALGARALEWLEQRSPRMGRFFRWLERLFQRFSYAVVVLLPGPGMSTIAGASGMAPRVFLPLVGAGLVLRMVLTILLAEWLREPIEALLALIEEYRLPGTIVLVSGIALYQWRRVRKGQGASVESVESFEVGAAAPAGGDSRSGPTSAPPEPGAD